MIRAGRAVAACTVVLALSSAAPVAAAGSTSYGKLIAHASAGNLDTAEVAFGVRAPRAFWIVLTSSRRARFYPSWSIGCTDAGGHSHNTIGGVNNVGPGRWVKRLRGAWLVHRIRCDGQVTSNAVGGRLRLQVYAQY